MHVIRLHGLVQKAEPSSAVPLFRTEEEKSLAEVIFVGLVGKSFGRRVQGVEPKEFQVDCLCVVEKYNASF
jgi:hypothetical protein